MERRHQIVAGIPEPGASPVVLFDFDEWFRLGAGTDFSPPGVRYSNTWTQLQDGETQGASTLGDRTLKLVLNQFRGTAEDQAEVLQTLGRLLDDSRGQWFLWQDEGTVNERYFRTRRAPLSIEDHHLLENPKRTVTLNIPAAPTARGRKISDSVVITNNPVAGTNKIMAALPAIKGDVATPLHIEAVYSANTGIPVGIGSLAMPAGMPFAGPFWLDSAAMSAVAGTNYTWSTLTNAVYIGGTARKLTQGATPALTAQTVLSGIDVLAGIPSGDYRMFMRAGVDPVLGTDPVYDTNILLGNGSGSLLTIDTPTLTSAAGAAGTALLDWYDMGVVRLPTSAPGLDPALDTGIPASQTDIGLQLSGGGVAGGVFTVDGFLFIPVDLDLDRDCTWSTISRGAATGLTTIIDGITDQVIPLQTSGKPGNILSTFDGDLPRVTPGADNYIHALTGLLKPFYQFGGVSDPITNTVTLNWWYLPEYLYIRSATG